MPLPPSVRRPLERWVMPLLLTANLLLLLYYVARNYQFAVHSDSAVMNLLAQEIHETGQFFPRDWHYANGDLWVWFPHTVIVPLLNWLPNSYGLHALSSALTAALVLWGAWCVGAMLGQSRLARLTTLLVLSGGISANMAENLYGQAAYGVLFYMACFLAYSGWRQLRADGAARWRWGALFALLLVLVFWSNPQRAAVYYGLPLMLAALSQLPLSAQGGAAPPQRRVGALLALLAVALLAGAALHGHAIRLVNNHPLPPPSWLGFDDMLRNTLGTLRGLLSLLGGLPPAGAPVTTADGVLSALRIAAAVALLGLLPWALRRALGARQPAQVFFAVFTLTSTAINLFVALTTSVPDMSAPEAAVRYLVPSLLCMLLLLTGAAVDEFAWRRPAPVAALLALLVLGASATQAYRVAHSPGYYKGSIGAHSAYHHFAAYLEQQGLRYGYASFWNAGRLTLLSQQKVKVRPVIIDNGLPIPARHLSSDRWYRPDAWRGETFLMFTEAESKATDWPALERYAGPPSRVLHYRGWEIRVYPHNLAQRLPLWNPLTSPPLPLPVTAATPHQIGRLVDDGTALRAEPGERGALQFGPWRGLPAGSYLISFEIDTGGAGVGEFGSVDVSANRGGTLATQAIRGLGPQRVTVPLTLDGPAGDIEFRVWSNGAGRVTTRGVGIALQAPRPSTTD